MFVADAAGAAGVARDVVAGFDEVQPAVNKMTHRRRTKIHKMPLFFVEAIYEELD
jgi:hypothetical protein